MNRKIDFLIIGAQKSGTTSLYNWLAQHPDIFLPQTKEVQYFAKDEFYQQGEKYLDVFYEKYAGQRVIGGAYVHLMHFPYVAGRIHAYNPQMKIIAVLRNPIDRAYSSYWFARSNGWETSKTFEEALEKELVRAHGSYQEQAELTYLAHGRYAEQLQVYFDLFGPEQVMVFFSELLKHQPGEVIGRALDFLGTLPVSTGMDLSVESNRATISRFTGLQSILFRDGWYRKLGRKLLPASARMWIRERILLKIILWNRRPFQYPPMSSPTRQMLVDYFTPQNEKLWKLMGMNPDLWNQ